jgi:hypothetical protein
MPDTSVEIIRLTHNGRELCFFAVPPQALASVKIMAPALRALIVNDSQASLAASHTALTKALNDILKFLDELPYCGSYSDIPDLLRNLNSLKKKAEKFRLTAAEAAALDFTPPEAPSE